MRRTPRHIAALAVLLVAGACGTADTPLAPEATLSPTAPPSLNGGYAVGGNSIDGDTTTVTTSTTTQTDTTTRNGGYATGGN